MKFNRISTDLLPKIAKNRRFFLISLLVIFIGLALFFVEAKSHYVSRGASPSVLGTETLGKKKEITKQDNESPSTVDVDKTSVKATVSTPAPIASPTPSPVINQQNSTAANTPSPTLQHQVNYVYMPQAQPTETVTLPPTPTPTEIIQDLSWKIKLCADGLADLERRKQEAKEAAERECTKRGIPLDSEGCQQYTQANGGTYWNNQINSFKSQSGC